MMAAFVILLPYAVIMLVSWDRRQVGMGVVICLLLAIVEIAVAGHLWLAGVV
jgi:hypothetical protein